MLVAKPILAAVLAIGMGYVVYPYVTLYRLGHAVRAGDATTLGNLVNWPAVREGIKEDICDDVAPSPAQTASDDTLPPFGASFARGIAGSIVDQRVTPQGVLNMTHGNVAASDAAHLAPHVTWAFFSDPGDFIVCLDAPGQPGPIRLQMTLKHAAWQVTRIWLPRGFLQQADAGT